MVTPEIMFFIIQNESTRSSNFIIIFFWRVREVAFITWQLPKGQGDKVRVSQPQGGYRGLPGRPGRLGGAKLARPGPGRVKDY